MNEIMRRESAEITHRLATDALMLYVASGTGFLLAEVILPGIFSQRVDMVLFLAIFFGLVVFVSLAGRWKEVVNVSCKNGREKPVSKKTVWVTGIVSGVIVAVFFFLLSGNVPMLSRFALAVATAVGAAVLSQSIMNPRRV